LDLVRRGGVQNIVVKDLSRWGRNYPEVSEYLDQIFPFLGVRFISVNDQYDSNDHKGQTAPMGVAFSSIVHDIYSKELSVKVSQAHLIRAKRGEYVHGSNFYGYVRSKEKKNLLVIDAVAAVTVRRIFDMVLEGLTTSKIAAALNTEGVDSPLIHRIKSGQSTHGLKPLGGKSFWNNAQILRILRDERYTGMMVTHRNKVPSPGSNKRIQLPEHEWVKTPNAHEAIISAEQFSKAQECLRVNKKTPRGISPDRSPYAGKIVCGHCERNMSQRYSQKPYHYCKSVKLSTGQGCYDGKVFISDLDEILLATLKLEAQKALDLMEQQRSQNQAHNPISVESDSISSEIKRLNANVALLEQRSLEIYEEFAEGKMGREAYVAAKATSSANLEVTLNRIFELSQRLAIIESLATTQPSIANESVLHRIITATDTTGEVMSLLDRMVIYDGGRIEVRFVFRNLLDAVVGLVQSSQAM